MSCGPTSSEPTMYFAVLAPISTPPTSKSGAPDATGFTVTVSVSAAAADARRGEAIKERIMPAVAAAEEIASDRVNADGEEGIAPHFLSAVECSGPCVSESVLDALRTPAYPLLLLCCCERSIPKIRDVGFVLAAQAAPSDGRTVEEEADCFPLS